MLISSKFWNVYTKSKIVKSKLRRKVSWFEKGISMLINKRYTHTPTQTHFCMKKSWLLFAQSLRIVSMPHFTFYISYRLYFNISLFKLVLLIYFEIHNLNAITIIFTLFTIMIFTDLSGELLITLPSTGEILLYASFLLDIFKLHFWSIILHFQMKVFEWNLFYIYKITVRSAIVRIIYLMIYNPLRILIFVIRFVLYYSLCANIYMQHINVTYTPLSRRVRMIFFKGEGGV